MASYTVDYCKHATLAPNVVDVVTLTLGKDDRTERFSIGNVEAVVTHRGTTGELYFDFTYPDHIAPSNEVTPLLDNTFVVLPGQSFRITSDKQQPLDFVFVSDTAIPYSVMAVL